MKYIFLIALLFNYVFALGQDLEKDTIQLNDILIKHSNKKPQIKKFKFNDGNTVTDYDLLFNHKNVFFLTDSLPVGYIQEITLYFSQLSKQMRFEEWQYGSFKSNETAFELTIYEVNNDYTVGNKINDEPIPVTFEEIEKTKLKTKKVKVDLTPYKFKSSRFYIGLKKVTDTACEECYYYAPELHITGDENHYIVIKDEKGNKKQDSRNGRMLRSEVKTLTSYY